MATNDDRSAHARVALLTALLGLCILLGACGGGPALLQTQPMIQPPTIDGKIVDWGGRLTRVGDRPLSMSAHPTDSLLYVALLVQDRELIRSVAKNGLIVWVDPSGKERHTYGLQYPFGLRAQRRAQQASGGSRSGPPPLSQVFPSDFAVLRNDTVRHRAPARSKSSGLRVTATLNAGSMIYEAAIPIDDATADRNRHGVRTSLGSPLAIGLETPELDEDDTLSDDQQNDPPLVGQPGRGRTPRGRRRGGRRRGRRPPPQAQSPGLPTLDLWARVVRADRGGG